MSIRTIRQNNDSASSTSGSDGIFESWQRRLLQLDKRNNLLYFNERSKMAVKLDCSDLDELYTRITDSGDKGLLMPSCKQILGSEVFAIAGGELHVSNCEVPELQRRLSALRRRDREWEEEQGTNVLFIAFGLLEWLDENGVTGLAPIVLLPADLIQSSPRHPFFLCREPDEPVLNATLIYKLQCIGHKLPIFDPDVTITKYLAECEEILCRSGDYKIRKEVVLTCFAYSKMGMWADIQSMRVSGTDHPLLNAMLGGDKQNQLPDFEDGNRGIDSLLCGGQLDDFLAEREKFLVLPADYSQSLAIHYAQMGEHLIIHGPPGTGKSQTIANLIGTLLADGKTVLFVSEKTAALDVVKRRLDQSGLGPFCLDLHSERGKSAAVYEQLAESLCAEKSSVNTNFSSSKYKALQFRLNKLAQVLHEKRKPLNLSVFETHGRLSELARYPVPDFVIAAEEFLPERISQESLNSLLSICRKIANHTNEFFVHSNSFWKDLLQKGLSPLGLDDRIKQTATEFCEAASAYQFAGENLALAMKIRAPVSSLDIEQQQSVAKAVQKFKWCEEYPVSWLTNGDGTRIHELLLKQAALGNTRAQLLDELAPVVRDFVSVVIAELVPRIEHIGASEVCFERVWGHNWLNEVFRNGSSKAESICETRFILRDAHYAISNLYRIMSKIVPQKFQLASEAELYFNPTTTCDPEFLILLNEAEHKLCRAMNEQDSLIEVVESTKCHAVLNQFSCCLGAVGDLKDILSTLSKELVQSRSLTGLEFANWKKDSTAFDSIINTVSRVSAQALYSVRGGAAKKSLVNVRALCEVLKNLRTAERELNRLASLEICGDLELGLLDERCLSSRSTWKHLLNVDYHRQKRIINHRAKHHESLTNEALNAILAQARTVLRYRQQSAELQLELEQQLGKVDPEIETLQKLESELLDISSLLENEDIDKSQLMATLSNPEMISSAVANHRRLKEVVSRAMTRTQALEGVLKDMSQENVFDDLCGYLAGLESSLNSDEETLVALSPLLVCVSKYRYLIDVVKTLEQIKHIELQYSNNLSLLDIRGDTAFDWTEAANSVDSLAHLENTVTKFWTQESFTQLIVSGSFNFVIQLKMLEASRRQMIFRTKQLRRLVRLPWIAPDDPTFDHVLVWSQRLVKEADWATAWLHYTMLVQTLESIVRFNMIESLRRMTDQSCDIPPLVEKYFLQRWLDAIHFKEPVLGDFDGFEHERHIAAFEELDRVKLPIAATYEIQRRLFEGYPSEYARAAKVGETAMVFNEVRKQRRRLPIRQLLSKAPTMLRKIKPCFMMSPLAVSQILPPSSEEDKFLFDVLIFDEASQIFPEDAIPAISRCRQIVVVGDEQQLPPTNFFHRTSENKEVEDDVEDDYSVGGAESILSGIKKLVHLGVRECYLNMHYRSRDESLINFSNRHFYNNRLLAFPGPYRNSLKSGINDCFVPNAYFDAGKSRRNAVEAQRVVDLIFEHFSMHGLSRSLGVVALSRTQADFIYELLVERRKENPEFDTFFAEDTIEPFFVKNLENVQGDERDHIILCIGYGRAADGEKVPNRFGPINTAGGERRLNVAVSRARYNMTLVRSLHASDITSEQRGPQLLKQFILFCDLVTKEQNVLPDCSTDGESGFVQLVQNALVGAGYEVRNYSDDANKPLDLAIVSEDREKYDLGLIFDGSSFYGAPTARDREWLRKSILENLGWKLSNVWSGMWISNPKEALARIEDAIKRARTEVGPSLIPQQQVNQNGGNSCYSISTESTYAMLVRESIETDCLLFEEYQEASIWRSTYANTTSDSTISAMLLRLAQLEGPIHFEEALDRMRDPLNLGRVGSKLRTRFEMVLRALQRTDQVWITFDKEGSPKFFSGVHIEVKPRSPVKGKAPRKIDRIAPMEIQSGILFVVRELASVGKDDCIKEVARQFGYSRVGPDILETITAAIKKLTSTDRLIEHQGVLKLKY